MSGDEAFILKKIKNRVIRKNQNFLSVTVGDTGSGKTYSAIRMAEIMDPNFTIDNIVFDSESFLELVDSKKLKKGACIVWDEAGVNYSARKWYSEDNEMMNAVMQSFRILNYIVLYTTPDPMFVDKIARKLFHAELKPLTIDHKNKICILRFFRLERNGKKTYTIYFRKGGKPIKKIKVRYPENRELLKEYEKRKKKFVSDLIKRGLDKFRARREKAENPKMTDDEMVKKVLKDKEYYLVENKGKEIIDKDLIMIKFGVGRDKANIIKKVVELDLGLR